MSSSSTHGMPSSSTDGVHEEPLNAYELQRNGTIRDNKRKLKELGLLHSPCPPPKKPRQLRSVEPQQASRSSKRLEEVPHIDYAEERVRPRKGSRVDMGVAAVASPAVAKEYGEAAQSEEEPKEQTQLSEQRAEATAAAVSMRKAGSPFHATVHPSLTRVCADHRRPRAAPRSPA